MPANLQPISTRIPQEVADRIDAAAKAHGLKPSEYLRDLIAKATEVTVPYEEMKGEMIGRMDELSQKIDHLSERSEQVSSLLAVSQEGMASLAAMLATMQGQKPEDAKAWARKLFFTK